MNRLYGKSIFKLLGLPIVVASSIALSGCNSKPSETATQPSASPSTTVKAQNPLAEEDSARRGTDPLELFQNPQVKEELELTNEQSAKLKQISTDFRKTLKQTVLDVKLEGLSEEEKNKKLLEIRDKFKPEVEKTRDQVEAVLTTEQIKRAKGIALQTYGLVALNSPEFQDDLKIDKWQQEKLDKIRTEMGQKMRDKLQTPPNEDLRKRKEVIEQNRQEIAQILKETNQQVLEVLSPEQKKIVENLKGKKFELQPPAPRSDRPPDNS